MPRFSTPIALTLAALSLSAYGHAGPTPPPPTAYRAAVFGPGAGEAERLAHCACVTSAGRADLCVPLGAWDPIITEPGRVYASGCEYLSTDPALTLLFYTCGGPGHTGYMLNEAGPTAHSILTSGTCDPNGVVRDAQAAVACAYVNGEMPAPMPPRGAFASSLHACQPGARVAAE